MMKSQAVTTLCTYIANTLGDQISAIFYIPNCEIIINYVCALSCTHSSFGDLKIIFSGDLQW